MDDYSFNCLFSLSLPSSLFLSLFPDLLFPIPPLFKSKSGGQKRIGLEVETSRRAYKWRALSLPSLTLICRQWRDKGMQTQQWWKKGGLALSEWNNKCLGVCRSCENTGTSSLVAAVALRISKDCSHVRDRCTKCVFGRLRGSRDVKKSSANN